MAQKKIFIASSTEAREQVAEPIARLLAERGDIPVRWWRAFSPSEFTLPRLQELAQTVEGAVFVCHKDDHTWYRGKRKSQPRDNVLLELGIFIQALGPRKCVVVRHPDVDLPTDLAGLSFLSLEADIESTAEKVANHFRHSITRKRKTAGLRPEVIPLEIDPALSELAMSRPLPKGWNQRALYLGMEGASGWLSVVSAPESLDSADMDLRRQQMLRALGDIDVRSYISMGPGDSETDVQIVVNLDSDGSGLRYIPVDISDGLLARAYSRIYGLCHIPMGILGDFEEGLHFVERRVDAHADRPLLVGLLGNTFGNLDRFERDFMRQICRWLKRGDHLLIEVTVATEKWKIPSSLAEDEGGHTEPLRRFYARGISRQTGASVDELLSEYDERIVIQAGRSDVPGARGFEIFDRIGRVRAMSLRRYNWERLLRWLAKEFPLQIVRSESFLFHDHEIGMGTVLVHRI